MKNQLIFTFTTICLGIGMLVLTNNHPEPIDSQFSIPPEILCLEAGTPKEEKCKIQYFEIVQKEGKNLANSKDVASVGKGIQRRRKGPKIDYGKLLGGGGLEPQRFSFHSSVEFMSILDGNIDIAFQSNAFQFEDGSEVQGEVELVVHSFGNKIDFIKAGLFTMSNEKLLESGGMFHIEAKSEGREIFLKRDKPMFLDFNNNKGKKGMRLFAGKEETNSSGEKNVNWIKMNKVEGSSRVFENNLVYDLSNPDLFRVNTNCTLLRAITDRTFRVRNVPISEFVDNPMEVKVNTVPFIVQISYSYIGEMIDFEVIGRGSKRIKRLLSKSQRYFNRSSGGIVYSKGKTNDRVGYRVTYSGSLHTKTKDYTVFPDYSQIQAILVPVFDSSSTTAAVLDTFFPPPSIYDSYSFQTTNLGWINCDRFYNVPTGNLYVAVEESGMECMVFLNKRNSLFPSWPVKRGFAIEQAPLRKPITTIAFKEVKGGFLLASEKTYLRSKKNKIVLPDLTFYTEEGFLEELNRLVNM